MNRPRKVIKKRKKIIKDKDSHYNRDLINELAIEYYHKRSEKLKNLILIKSKNIICAITGRMYKKFGGSVTYYDIFSYGYAGALDALNRFDINKGTKFTTYLNTRAFGTIIDEVRKQDFLPRSTRDISRFIDEFKEDFYKKNGYEPNGKDYNKMFIEKGINPKNVNVFCFLPNNYNVFVSMDSNIETETLSDGFGIKYKEVLKSSAEDPAETILEHELRQIVLSDFDDLPDNLKKVAYQYFVLDLTLREIGDNLEVTESRASQLVKKIKNESYFKNTREYFKLNGNAARNKINGLHYLEEIDLINQDIQ